jgi:glutamine synthetase type III
MDPELITFATKIQSALDHLKKDLSSIRAGRANSSLLEDIPINAYGAQMTIMEVGTITTPQPTLLTVQVWDPGMVKDVEKAVLKLGVSKIPEVMKDNTDRNRTSPFAFTGNKFEFRAVGSSASTAFPVTLLNAAVADGFVEVTEALKSRSKSTKTMEAAILEVLKDVIRDTRSIRFEGNNYSEDWVKEAERRGLPNLRKTPEALAEIVSPKSKAVLTGLGIFTDAEVHRSDHRSGSLPPLRSGDNCGRNLPPVRCC